MVAPYGVNQNDGLRLLRGRAIALTMVLMSEVTAVYYHHALAREFAERHFSDPKGVDR